MTHDLKVNVQDTSSIISYLEEARSWNTRRSNRPSLVLNGYYLNLGPEHQALLEALQEDFCRTKIAEYAEHLYNLGVHLDLDFDFQEHLAGKAAAQAAAEAKANAIEASADELG